ncbi:hypothetical protein SJAG_03054 [Schizosaccharomyces japonicus yFS275]|uniref:Conserved oligomeric Golgi complex subunit 8 n=1 Tax=Schizosaccharomyces japonicus (strain yFS275 / FY16936) TaxID=402676 RepID=B6K372_SCHJY|nr:hypothetical protein SJAG_03054 [Schizosaccharomyces japonicus yFS275]EEB07929.1 hypothetical protein SJAG_03054 [Schizosaccharomyces japonicus yFS275]
MSSQNSIEQLLIKTPLDELKKVQSYLQKTCTLSEEELALEEAELLKHIESIEDAQNLLLQDSAGTLTNVSTVYENTEQVKKSVFEYTDLLRKCGEQTNEQLVYLRSFVKDVLEHRDLANIMLEKQVDLQAVLEIPSSMAFAINNNLFSEAMEFRALAERIIDAFPESSTIRGLGKQVTALNQTLVETIIRQLQQPQKLFHLIKLVSHLKTAAQFSEQEIMTLYMLNARLQLQSALQNISSLLNYNSPEVYVRRYLQIIRERAFVLFSNYQCLFQSADNDDEDMTASGNKTVPSQNKQTQDDLSLAQDQEGVRSLGNNIVSVFCMYVIDELMYILKTFMPRITDSATRSSLLLQLFYCNQSLTKVGCDITSQLKSLFGKEWAEIVAYQSSSEL